MQIKTKILITVILLSLFVNVIAMNLYITEKKNDLFNILNLKIENNNQLLKQINSKLLYNLDSVLIKINLESFLNDIDIVSIELKESDKEKNENLNFVFEEKNYDKSKIIKYTTYLEYSGVDVGMITTSYTTSNIDKALSKSIISIVISFILVTFLISAALYILLNKFTKPITDLTKISSLIASGNLEKHINVQSNDEIGVLSKSFEYMRISLKERKEKIETLNKNLQSKVEKRTEALSQQTKKVTDLLNNAAQGFLSFDRDFLIDDEYSIECENLLGKELINQDITRLLFPKDSKALVLFKENIIDAFDSDNELTTSLILTLLPSELIINKRAILIKYKIISDDKIMMILTNITDKKRLQNKIKKEQRIQKMILTIVSDSSQFYEIKNSFEEFCKDILLYIHVVDSVEKNSNTITAFIHTFKGLFAQQYMGRSVNQLHRFESEILEFSEDAKNNNNDLKDFIESFDILACMNEDLDIIIDVLGNDFMNQDTQIKIDEAFITYLEEKIGFLYSLDIQQKHEYEEILHEIKKIKYKPLKYYLSRHPKFCQQLCVSLNKSIYAFEINGSDVVFITDKYKPFINSLIHVFRNSCDHGIETKEDRISRDKGEMGTISCSFEAANNKLYIEISDDGKGIDLDALKKKILENKLVSIKQMDDLTEKEIIDFIFNDNFTTNDSITHISGRGIGLSAVKAELDKLDGEISIETNLNEGTLFRFRLPFNN